jgi:hypothetical protein
VNVDDPVQPEILAELLRRRVTRLCHFTHPRNLDGILDRGGLWSATELKAHGWPHLSNDDLRLDGRPDLISCSVEVPNARLMRRLEGEFVVLALDPELAAARTSRFSRHNASKHKGELVGEGPAAFKRSFSAGRGPFEWRSDRMSSRYPTDFQAEVLLDRHVPIGRIREVIVQTSLGVEVLPSSVARFARATGLPVRASPTMFDADALLECVRSGDNPPIQTIWAPS